MFFSVPCGFVCFLSLSLNNTKIIEDKKKQPETEREREREIMRGTVFTVNLTVIHYHNDYRLVSGALSSFSIYIIDLRSVNRLRV